MNDLPGAGELDRRVTIRLRNDIPDDDDGGLEPIFPSAKRCWAKIESVGAVTYSAGVQIDQRVTHRVTIRYRHGIGDGHEVVESSKGRVTVYRVRRIAHLQQQFTQLEVEEL